LTTLPGAVIAYIYLKEMLVIVPYVLALSAASFLYIAMSDLIPTLHRKIGIKANIAQFILMLAGIGTIALLRLQH
jgi:zinc and cadmium transporter